MDSIFLGAMITISSTTIILKALDELKLKTRRFAQLIFATLVVEDLTAILLLVALTTLASSGELSASNLLSAVMKLVLVVSGWILAGYLVIPTFIKYAARKGNNEVLLLLALGLCLGLVVAASHYGYSPALGAFIMGSILAETPIVHRIEERMEPLKDVFGAIFFVSIGMLINPAILWEYKMEIAILSAVVITGKIFSASLGWLISGQSVRNSVQVGFSLAQIGEFSFIIAGTGLALQATSAHLYPVAVAVSLVTTFTTPYLIRYSGPIAHRFERALPNQLCVFLSNYADWLEQRRAVPKARHSFAPHLLRWIINGLAVSVIFLMGAEYLHWKRWAVWITAVAASAPFIWGMMKAFRGSDISSAVLVFGMQGLSLVWIGGLSSIFFPARYVAIIAAAVLLVLYALFHKRLESSYQWFENQFLSTFEEPATEGTAGAFKHLAPWNAHLAQLNVHANARLALTRLADSQLRSRYGVNVVAIRRGVRNLVAPKPDELLLPGDELLVLATDEQLDAIKADIENPVEETASEAPDTGYELRKVLLTNDSPLVGQSIRHAGIRETYGAMVVGIERDQTRTMNPESDLVLQVQDLLWVVGSRPQLDRMSGRV
jgi:CPA2 family monovalent cation:H+ antiporter-2